VEKILLNPKGVAVAARECLTLKTLLSILYKSAALASIVTIVVTLDVGLSLAVIVVAFSLYYASRAVVARLCPRHSYEEHKAVVRALRPSRQRVNAARDAIGPAQPNNVTPLRPNISPTRHTAEDRIPARVKVKSR